MASGKGGVGKTTVSVNLAVALADAGYRVGLVDADLYGPDVPLMFGLTRTAAATGIDVWRAPGHRRRWAPVEVLGVKLFSVQFLLGEDQALAAPATFAGMLLTRMFTDVDWGELDVLIVDLPPGTADLQQQIVAVGSANWIVVVTPEDVAHLDARKLLATLNRGGAHVVGGVENMAPMSCPCCGTKIELHPPAKSTRSIWAQGVPLLASIPFTPQTGNGLIVRAHPRSLASDAIHELARAVLRRIAEE